MGKLREVIRRWDWILVALVAPSLLFPSAERGWLLLAVPVVLGVQWWVWRSVLPVTALNPAILLLALMTGVSVWVTPDITASLPKIAGVLLGIMVYFTVVRHGKTLQGWRGTLAFYALAGVGVAMVGLAGTRWFTTKFTGLNSLTNKLPVRLTGLPGAEGGIHPNEVAGAMLWVVPLVVMGVIALIKEPKWLASPSGRGKVRKAQAAGWGIILAGASVVSAAVLVLAQSRGGYLAILLAVIVLALFVARGWARKLIVAGLVWGVLVGAILVSHAGVQGWLNQLTDSLPLENTTVASLSTLNGRVEIWSRAIWSIRDVPLTGLGMNIFRKAIYILYPTYQVPAEFNLGHAHNEILQVALDLGLPGLTAFLALYAGAVWMLARELHSGGTVKLIALGLLGGLLAHFFYGLTDAVALGAKPGVLWWWLLGMVVGLYEQCRPAVVVSDR